MLSHCHANTLPYPVASGSRHAITSSTTTAYAVDAHRYTNVHAWNMYMDIHKCTYIRYEYGVYNNTIHGSESLTSKMPSSCQCGF